MGIRFSCHSCGKSLNIKNELAGRRGVCPECQTRFRIPVRDTDYSIPIGTKADAARVGGSEVQVANAAGSSQSSGAAVSDLGRTEATSSPAANSTAGQTTAGQTTAGQTTAEQDTTRQSPIDLIDSEPTTTWYVRPPSGGQYGPADAQVLRGWIKEGRVARTALLWREGWPQWREAAEALPEIADSLPGPVLQTVSDPLSESDDSRKTTSIAHESTRPIDGGFAGDAKIGATRRKRTSRRLTLVAVLAALVIGLIITLIIVSVSQNQPTSRRESDAQVSRGG